MLGIDIGTLDILADEYWPGIVQLPYINSINGQLTQVDAFALAAAFPKIKRSFCIGPFDSIKASLIQELIEANAWPNLTQMRVRCIKDFSKLLHFLAACHWTLEKLEVLSPQYCTDAAAIQALCNSPCMERLKTLIFKINDDDIETAKVSLESLAASPIRCFEDLSMEFFENIDSRAARNIAQIARNNRGLKKLSLRGPFIDLEKARFLAQAPW